VANVLPLSLTKDLCGDILPSEASLRSYSGDILPSGGKVTLGLDKDGVTTLDFELVDANVVPILGLDACVGLGTVKRIDNLNNQAILDQTDHQPLVSIIKKSLWMASPRLQKLLIRMQRYQVREISYVPGKFLYLADTLSRAYLSTTEPAIEDDVVMVHCLQLEDSAKLALIRAYAQDDTTHSLKSTITGEWNWPTKKQVPLSIQPFWNFRDELFLKEDLVYRAGRLVIPQSECSAYLKKLHMGHLGMEKCIERTKQSIFWLGINGDIR